MVTWWEEWMEQINVHYKKLNDAQSCIEYFMWNHGCTVLDQVIHKIWSWYFGAAAYIFLEDQQNKLVYQLSVDEGNRRREGDNSWSYER